MVKMRIRYRVVIRGPGREIYYANRDPSRPLPHCRWATAAQEYPDHFTEIEAIDICQLYSDQRPTKHKVRLNVEADEEVNA